MNNNEPKHPYDAKLIYRNPKDHGYYYGSYLNMARHNAWLILNELSEKYGHEKETILKENQLHEASVLKAKLSAGHKIKAKELQRMATLHRKLTEHFPFVQALVGSTERDAPGEEGTDKNVKYAESGGDLKSTAEALRYALTELNQLRNRYTHYPNDQATAPQQPTDLTKVFDSAREKILGRYPWLQREHVQHLDSRETAADRFYHHMRAQDGSLTDNGLCFFICLFLDQGAANLFLSRVYGFKNTADEAKQATRKCYTIYCCKLPQPKLESSDPMLDMVNELWRCPRELWGLLAEDDRERFRVAADLPEGAEADEETPKVAMVRGGDRYPQLVLRYFEEYERRKGKPFFEQMRFQLHLARLRTPENPDTRGDRTESREWMRELNAYGRPDQYEKKDMPKSWKDENDRMLDAIEQYSPQYRIIGNRIGLKLFANPLEGASWPKVKDILEQVAKKARDVEVRVNTKPDAILSTHELQNLFLYQHLYHEGKIAEPAEALIMAYKAAFHRLCADAQRGVLRPVSDKGDFRKQQEGYKGKDKTTLEHRTKQLQEKLDGYGIRVQDLPDSMREYLLGYSPPSYAPEARAKLKARITETKELLKKTLTTGDPSDPSGPVRTLRAGELASELAADINYLKPLHDDKKGRASEEQYRLLQEHLAFFSIRKEALKELFSEMGLIGRDVKKPHPFLHRIRWQECTGVLHFYREYFAAKLDWLKEMKNYIRPGERYVNKKQKYLTPEELQDQLEHILQIEKKKPRLKNYLDDQPIMLPRGLFNRAISAALSTTDIGVKPGDNVVYALDRIVAGDTHPMYGLRRQYLYDPQDRTWYDGGMDKAGQLSQLQAAITAVKQNKKRGKETEYALNDAKQAKARMLDKEQRLRQIQSNDRSLMLMIRELATSQSQEVQKGLGKMKMSGIRYPADPRPEDGTTSTDLLDIRIEMATEIPGTQRHIADKLKIKDYGKFRKLLKDRRLTNLVRYYPEQAKINQETLRQEIMNYDTGRLEVMEAVADYERAAYGRWREELDKRRSDKGYIDHSTYLGVTAQSIDLEAVTSLKKEALEVLRNRFSHNEVPYDDGLIKSKIDTASEGTITKQLVELAKRAYQQLTDAISISVHEANPEVNVH